LIYELAHIELPSGLEHHREPSYDDADNIMGIGDKVAPWNTMPWVIRLFQHIGIGPQGWKPMKEIVPPKIL
jgi:hypothetical protein